MNQHQLFMAHSMKISTMTSQAAKPYPYVTQKLRLRTYIVLELPLLVLPIHDNQTHTQITHNTHTDKDL